VSGNSSFLFSSPLLPSIIDNGGTKAGLDKMTGQDGMMEWDRTTREPAEMEKQAETLMRLAKMRI